MPAYLPPSRIPAVLLALALGLLAGCAAPTPTRSVYDFGPGATRAPAQTRQAPLPPLLLAEVDAPAALDGTAVLYRLAYADARQPRPYAQARWSMVPAQLLRQRLREALGQRRSVLGAGDAVPPGTLVLRVELEEFSQLFESPRASAGLVRLRATLLRSGNPAKLLAQAGWVEQQPAATPDAAGGVAALAQASDALVAQLDAWVQQVVAADGGAP